MAAAAQNPRIVARGYYSPPKSLFIGFRVRVCGVSELARKIDVKILVDFLCFTVSVLDFVEGKEDYDYTYLGSRIEQKLLLEGLQFQNKRAFNGYNNAMLAGGVMYCYGGRDDIFIQMSGTGCRTFESLHPGLTWESWIRQLQATYGSLHFSRMDIACDTFGDLKIRTIQLATMSEKFVSKWRTYLCQVGNKENSVIFGSAKSDFRLRIYDKTQERQNALGAEVEVPADWVRLEFQLRNDAVTSFLRPWQESGDVSTTFFGILRNQLSFFTKYDGVHTDRMVLTPWWRKLLGNVGRIRMAYQGGCEYNLQNLENYVFKQAGSSIQTYLLAKDGDLSALMQGVYDRKLNDRQKQWLASIGVDVL